MTTTIDLDQKLIDEVVSLGGFHSARDAVSTALSSDGFAVPGCPRKHS
jgi:hypothetical protein